MLEYETISTSSHAIIFLINSQLSPHAPLCLPTLLRVLPLFSHPLPSSRLSSESSGILLLSYEMNVNTGGNLR